MIYAIYTRGSRETLVQFPSLKALLEKNRKCEALEDGDFRRVLSAAARQWVLDGKEHETGLFLDDGGKLRYAPPQPEKHSPSDRSAPSFDPLHGSIGLATEQGNDP